MKNKNILKIIDQTNIRPDAKSADIIKTCQESLTFDFRGVCVNPQWVKLVRKQLKGSGIKVICLVDPPIGDSTRSLRIKICKKAKKDGADETDVVIPIPLVKHGKWQDVLADLRPICRILPTKVIIGSGYLTDDEIIKASQTVKRAGAICVKTATDKDPLEHRELKEKASHIKLMKKSAPGLLIKASGKINTLNDLKEMVLSGADIVGTSSGVEIATELLRN